MKTLFQDKPAVYPRRCPNGTAMKSLPQALLDRRATSHFKPDAVPEEYLETILQFAGQAPSGYNLQPWRFVVVREKENRQRLQAAAYNQEKIIEAPAVIITFAIRDDWKNYIDAIFEESLRRGYGKPEIVANLKKQASDFLEHGIPQPLWLNRHTMIAFTTMMLVAETYGLDTAPMEGFDPAAVIREFGLPDNAEVVALLAVGYAQEPDKPYGGRLDLSQIVHDEHFGRPWASRWQNADHASRAMFDEIHQKVNEPLNLK
jgi:nitroreductase